MCLVDASMADHLDHHASRTHGEAEVEDPYENAIERSGCARYHHALQDCYLEHGDWRKCQEEMQEFRRCVDEQNKRKQRTKPDTLASN